MLLPAGPATPMADACAERMEAGMLPQGAANSADGYDAKPRGERPIYGANPGYQPSGYPATYQPPAYPNSFQPAAVGPYQYEERSGLHLDWLFFGRFTAWLAIQLA